MRGLGLVWKEYQHPLKALDPHLTLAHLASTIDQVPLSQHVDGMKLTFFNVFVSFAVSSSFAFAIVTPARLVISSYVLVVSIYYTST